MVTFVVGVLNNLFNAAPGLIQTIVAFLLCILILFIHWCRVFLFLSCVLNIVCVACSGFFQRGYTHVQIFLHDCIRRSVLNPQTTVDSTETIQTRF